MTCPSSRSAAASTPAPPATSAARGEPASTSSTARRSQRTPAPTSQRSRRVIPPSVQSPSSALQPPLRRAIAPACAARAAAGEVTRGGAHREVGGVGASRGFGVTAPPLVPTVRWYTQLYLIARA